MFLIIKNMSEINEREKKKKKSISIIFIIEIAERDQSDFEHHKELTCHTYQSSSRFHLEEIESGVGPRR